MRGEGEERQSVEDEPVKKAVHDAFGRQQHDKHHHELGIEDQEPGDGAAHDAAAVADEPHGVGAAVRWWGGAVLGLQVAGLPLNVPGALRRALHPTRPVAAAACCADWWQEVREERSQEMSYKGTSRDVGQGLLWDGCDFLFISGGMN